MFREVIGIVIQDLILYLLHGCEVVVVDILLNHFWHAAYSEIFFQQLFQRA